MGTADVDAAGFAYVDVSPVALPAGEEHYYLASHEVAGGDCFYGAYKDSCGGTSGGLPMYFTGTSGPLVPQGGVYRQSDGVWIEDHDEQQLKETRRGYGAVNALIRASGDVPTS